ncbi:MAG: methionine biosynthesis protein MetW [Victivallaceae bacterium]
MTAQEKRRRDLEIVSGLIAPQSRVLDLGCGDGGFLRQLKDEKEIDELGLEIDQTMVARCVANGVAVIQGDLDSPLDFAEDGSFDVVMLSQTMQQLRHPDRVLREIVRVGKCAVVSFINFGHFPCRWSLFWTGRMPETDVIPYHWYDTPNIHLGTILDFRHLCRKMGISVVREIPIGTRFELPARLFPNFFAPGCVFVLERRAKK